MLMKGRSIEYRDDDGPEKEKQKHPYAAAATTGVATGAAATSGFDSSVAIGSDLGSAAASATGSDAGFSRGATGVGSSIFGGFSSTLGG